MPFGDKVMKALKKVGKVIHNPKTGNKIEIPSALSSDDPEMQKKGEEMADKVIAKAKAQMKKSSGLKTKLDRQRRPDDPGVKVKGYDKTDPYLQKVHTLKPPPPKKTKKDPDKPKADHEHEIERTMSPANKKKYDAAVKQAEKDFSAQLKKMDPSQQSWETARQYYDYDVNKAKEKYQDPLTPDQQAYQDYQQAKKKYDSQRRYDDRGDGKMIGLKNPNKYLAEPKPGDFPGAQAHIDKAKGIEPTPQEPEKKKKKSSSKKSSSKKKQQQQPGYPYHPDNPNRLMRAGKNLSRKEAKQYVKENKKEVLKYVIKKIIKEELGAS